MYMYFYKSVSILTNARGLITLLVSLFWVSTVSNAQWSRTGTNVSLTNAGDSVVLNSTTTNTPVSKLVVNGGVQLNSRTGVSALITIPPSNQTGQAQADENRINIQNAINRIESTGGGTIELMSGVYPLSRTPNQDYCLLLRHGVILKGASMRATYLIPINSGTSYARQLEVIRLAEFGAGWPNCNTYIRDLWISGNARTNITGINLGVYGTNGGVALWCNVENVRVQSCAIGILVQSYGSQINNCVVDGPGVVGIALRHFTGTPPNAVHNAITTITTVKNCHIHAKDTALIISGSGSQITGCILECNDLSGRFGIWIDDHQFDQQPWNVVAGNNIIGNWFQSTNGDPQNATAISIGNSLNTYVTGNYFDGIQSARMITFRSAVPEGFQQQCNFGRDGALHNAIYETLGINITNPGSSFQVNGNASIGYSSSSNGPANGLAISGSLGVGTLTPKTRLQLSGSNAAITFSEQSATPTTGPSSGNEAQMYVKADKLILRYLDGATMRYKYLPLNGTSSTWVHTTSAP